MQQASVDELKSSAKEGCRTAGVMQSVEDKSKETRPEVLIYGTLNCGAAVSSTARSG